MLAPNGISAAPDVGTDGPNTGIDVAPDVFQTGIDVAPGIDTGPTLDASDASADASDG